jgi:hypothetical protein
MSKKRTVSLSHPDHPSHAVKDPKGFYERAFRNYPTPLAVQAVGRLASRFARPSVSFMGASSASEYFSQIEDMAWSLSFSHYGKKDLHDPGAAAAAVFGTVALLERVEGIRTWVASPYMVDPYKGPVLRHLGGVSVNRSKDYVKLGAEEPTEEEKAAAREALYDRSAEHLNASNRNTIAVFPAGTKGGTILRDGEGEVLERVESAAALPIVLLSDSAATSHRPQNLRIIFAEPVLTEAGMSAANYMACIAENMSIAEASGGH